MYRQFRILVSLVIVFLGSAAQAKDLKITHFDVPYSVSKHYSVSDQAVLEVFNERCRNAAGNETTLNKAKALENVDGFVDAVTVYDLAYLRCEGLANAWELGVVSMGSGGSEWAVTVGGHWIVRVRAMSLEVKVINQSELLFSAVVHPTYCENIDDNCVKEFKLLQSD